MNIACDRFTETLGDRRGSSRPVDAHELDVSALLSLYDCGNSLDRDRATVELARRCGGGPHTRVLEGAEALAAATRAQAKAARRIRGRSAAVKGYLLMSDGTLTVGYETEALSRDRNADISPDGTVTRRD